MAVQWFRTAMLLVWLTMPTAARGDQQFQLGPGEYQWVPFTVKQPPAEVTLQFEVLKGSPTAHIEVLAIEEFRSFYRGKPHEVIASTSVGAAGAFRKMIYTRGEYAVVLKNEPKAAPVIASLLIAVDANPKGEISNQLSPGKRYLVVALSLIFFAVTAVGSGRAVLGAMRRDRYTRG